MVTTSKREMFHSLTFKETIFNEHFHNSKPPSRNTSMIQNLTFKEHFHDSKPPQRLLQRLKKSMRDEEFFEATN